MMIDRILRQNFSLVLLLLILVSPTFSQDQIGSNDKILFTSNRDGDWEVFLGNADGSDLNQLTDNDVWDGDASWAPDGDQIVFSSQRDGNSEIYIMNADGTEIENLTNHEGIDIMPSWSPTGQHIAFASNRNGNIDIYIMQSDGSGLRRLTDHPAIDSAPSWSPDGQEIVFASQRRGTFKLYIMDVENGDLRQLTTGDSSDFAPAWSPDGYHIAFSSFQDGNWDIFVIGSEGGDIERITDNPANDDLPSWSPSSSEIIFVSDRDGNQEIYVREEENEYVLIRHDAMDSKPVWQPAAFQQLAYAEFTDDDEFGAVAVTSNGEGLVALTEKNRLGEITKVTGAIWLSSGGGKITVFLGDNGLPETVVADGYVYKLSNYSGQTIDIASVAPNGQITTVNDIKLTDELRQKFNQLLDGYQQQSNTAAVYSKAKYENGLSLYDTLRLSGLAIGTFTCVGGIIGAIPTGGVTLALGCGSLAVSVFATLYPDNQVARNINAVATAIPAAHCVTAHSQVLSAAGCAEFLVETSAGLIEADRLSSDRADSYIEIADHPEPTSTPLPTNTPLPPPCNVRTDWFPYIVASGDSLFLIAQRSGSSVNELAAANCLEDPSQIVVGQTIYAPSRIEPKPEPSQPTQAPTQPDQYGWNNPYISFVADRYTISGGQCVTIRWDLEYVKEVYFNGRGVTGHSSSVECPRNTTQYSLRIVRNDGTDIYRYISITVRSGY